MKDLLKTAGVLAAIAFIAAAVLGVTDSITREPIKKVAFEKKVKARKLVLPAHRYSSHIEKNFIKLLIPAKNFKGSLTNTTIASNYFKALDKKGNKIGFVFEADSPSGYGGTIKMIIGIKVLSNEMFGLPVVSDYNVITSAETPGLGKAAEKKLHSFFINKKKDSTKIGDNKKDTVSGATVTSMAIKDALLTSLRAAGKLLSRNFINLNIPEKHLKLIPFARTLTKIKLPGTAVAIKEIYEIVYFGFVQGYTLKGVFSMGGKKYLALAGIRKANGLVFLTKIFEMTASKTTPFKAEKFSNNFFAFKNNDKLEKADIKAEIDKKFSKIIIEGYSILKKMGKIK